MLIDAGFDTFAETTCQPYYAAKMGAPSIPPDRYFRMHMLGYSEGIDSERGIEWCCAVDLMDGACRPQLHSHNHIIT